MEIGAYNADELQEILNRIMQGIMSMITSALVRDRPIMLIFSPIILCCSAQKFYLLCSKLCSRIKIVLSLLSQFIYKFA